MGNLTVESALRAVNKIGLKDEDLMSTVSTGPNQVTCRRCGACCTHQQSIRLSLYDVARLAVSLQMPFKNFVRQHVKSIDAYDLMGHGLVPGLALTTKRGVCPFFKVAEGCGHYDARPDVCRLFPLNNLYVTRSALLKMMRSKDLEYTGCCVMELPNNTVFALDLDALARHAIHLDVTAAYLATAGDRWQEDLVLRSVTRGISMVEDDLYRGEYVRRLQAAFAEFDAHNLKLLAGFLAQKK